MEAELDPRVFVDRMMSAFGHDMLVPSAEDDQNSVWVDDDRVPTPGYYIKARIAPSYGWRRKNRIAILDFERDGSMYTIEVGQHETAAENERYIVEILQTLLRWIDNGILSWDAALAPFLHEPNDAWWRVLRCPPDATPAEAEAAYKRLAAVHHPDLVGGSHDAFLRIRSAYDDFLRRIT